jgi:hypothetical protein
VLEELVDQRAAQAAGADDEHAPHADAVAPRLLEVAADRGAAGEDEEHVEPRKKRSTSREYEKPR